MANLLEHRLPFSIGGIRADVRLAGPPPRFADRLRRRYADFLHARGAPRLTLRLEPAAHPLGPRDPVVQGDRLRRHDFDVRLRGPSGDGHVAPNVYAFDSLLRVVWTLLLAERGGGLFHAAGVRIGDRTFLFPGRSGAGKSTLARKVKRPARVLTDELVPVRRGPRGWEAFGAPFWGEFQAGRSAPEGRPLQAVAFLRKGRRLAVRPLSTAEAARRLLETYLCFDQDASAHLAFATRLAAAVPAVELTSPLRSSFAQIREVLSQ